MWLPFKKLSLSLSFKSLMSSSINLNIKFVFRFLKLVEQLVGIDGSKGMNRVVVTQMASLFSVVILMDDVFIALR